MKLTDLAKLPKFVLDHKLAYINNSTNPDYDGTNVETDNLTRAEVILSTVDGDYKGEKLHKPVLDVDLNIQVLPSSTEGHHHLFIDKEMTWSQYEKLLTVLADVGIIEKGYLGACKSRKHSAVRLPWVKKPKIELFL
jgi:hypothetical protein